MNGHQNVCNSAFSSFINLLEKICNLSKNFKIHQKKKAFIEKNPFFKHSQLAI